MSVRPLSAFFSQTSVDSGALTVHVAVAHQFTVPGHYSGSVLRGDGTLAAFALDVDPACPERQVSIDLAGGAVSPGAALAPRALEVDCEEDSYRVAPGGYVLCRVGSGAGGLAARIGPAGEKLKAPTFDSRELGKGDLVVVTLVRPGTYRATFGNGEAKLRVLYPDPTVRLVQLPPVEFEASEQGIAPAGAEIQPTQGQLYRLVGPGRLRIDLVEPEDRKRDDARPIHRRRFRFEAKPPGGPA